MLRSNLTAALCALILGAAVTMTGPRESSATPVGDVVLDFDAFAFDNAAANPIGQAIEEDGFRVSLDDALGMRSTGSFHLLYTGTPTIQSGAFNATFTLEALDGEAFDLVSFDAGATVLPVPGGTTFTGEKSGGGTVSFEVSWDGSPGLQTFLPASFTDLVGVHWDAGSVFSDLGQFDNFVINTASVPEPSSGVLLAVGLAGLGWVRRRSRACSGTRPHGG